VEEAFVMTVGQPSFRIECRCTYDTFTCISKEPRNELSHNVRFYVNAELISFYIKES
jgi:hypothetical protein